MRAVKGSPKLNWRKDCLEEKRRKVANKSKMRKRYRSSPNLSCKEGRFAIVGPALLLWPIIDVRLPQTGSKTSPPARHYQGECTV